MDNKRKKRSGGRVECAVPNLLLAPSWMWLKDGAAALFDALSLVDDFRGSMKANGKL